MTLYKGLLLLVVLVVIAFILYSQIVSHCYPPGDIHALSNKETESSAQITVASQINPENDVTYTKLHPFLLSTPKTVMRTTPPKFLSDVKNPCFAIDHNFINIGNINLSYALKMNYEIRCLPYVYIAGKFVRLYTITFIKINTLFTIALINFMICK